MAAPVRVIPNDPFTRRRYAFLTGRARPMRAKAAARRTGTVGMSKRAETQDPRCQKEMLRH